MKILQINSVCGIGSTGRITADLCREAIARGEECRVAYGRNALNCEDIPTIRIGTKFDYYWHGLLSRLFDLHGFGSVGATKRFLKVVKEYDPDIIHLHNIHGYYINMQILFNYLKSSNKLVYWTLHDCWAFTGHCACYGIAECNKWVTECSCCQQKKKYPSCFLFDRSKSNYKLKKRIFNGVPNLTILTPSNWLKLEVEKSFLKDYPIEVRNNVIDYSMFKYVAESDFRTKHFLANKFVVLCVTNVWDDDPKFIDVLKLSEMLDNRFQVVVVGLTLKQIKKLPKTILGIEKTSSTRKLAEIYSTSDVFINPTYEDNYPTVNLEAQACGALVITYNTGGSPETIREGMGYVVERGNLFAMYNMILNVYKSK